MIFRPSRAVHERDQAYTLLEAMLVVIIGVTLVALVVTAVRSIQENLHLTHAGQLLVDQIDGARRLAATHNCIVYVYLYKVPAVSPTGYSAMQLWGPGPSPGASAAALLPLDRAYFFPSATVISEDPTRQSPLLNAAFQPAATPPLSNLSPTLSGASYVAFAVKPSGMLLPDVAVTDATGAPPPAASDLAASCLTMVPARFGAQTQTPANFVTVQINPRTGSCKVYRP